MTIQADYEKEVVRRFDLLMAFVFGFTVGGFFVMVVGFKHGS